MNTDNLTERIIGGAMKASSTLGVGFLESVYKKALVFELRNIGLKAETEKPTPVYYFNYLAGEFYADVMVENCVILELKVCHSIDDIHKAQLLNFLKATGIKVGLILNFGTKSLGIKRMVL